MTIYIFKRLLLIIPTLFGIMLLNFVIVQFAPGGPVEQMITLLTRGHSHDASSRFTGNQASETQHSTQSTTDAASNNMPASNFSARYRGAQGLDPELITELEKTYGFDQPASTRFWSMMKRYLHGDFGDSFFKNQSVVDLILAKLPVSISLGLWTTLLIYLISIPLGIHKAIRDGSAFDIWTSSVIVIAYAIPSFLFAILLIILFAGGSYWSIFPLRGLVSSDFETLSFWGKIADYAMHLVLPISAMVLSGFASLTMLCKNSFLDEIHKQYVLTARAKGLTEQAVLYGHVFRNAMLIVIAGLPDAFLKLFFTSAFLIEVIFSLDGLGLLGFEAAMARDYPIVFGTLFLSTLLGLIFNIIGDVVYVWVDPRIHFGRADGGNE
jgi:microcin C transport system permease protein